MDVFIIRLRSLSDKREKIALTFPGNPRKISVCNLEEEPAEPVTRPIQMLPYGMRTIRVEL